MKLESDIFDELLSLEETYAFFRLSLKMAGLANKLLE
jgi:hypothetical protein